LQRMNLLFSRARCLLIVICNPLTLKQEEHWNNFIKYCFDNKACTGENFEEMNELYGQPAAASELVVNPFAILKMNSGTRRQRGVKRQNTNERYVIF
jgi:hypothetical protein